MRSRAAGMVLRARGRIAIIATVGRWRQACGEMSSQSENMSHQTKTQALSSRVSIVTWSREHGGCRRLVVWINAFIPRDVPGYTVAITRGENAGKAAVPLPTAARFPIPFRNNLVKPLHTGYLTDQRSFSADPNASVRMQSFITISLLAGQVSGIHQTSGTTEVNMESGETRDSAEADMSDCQHSPPYAFPYEPAQYLYERRNSLSKGELNLYTSTLTRLDNAKRWIWTGSETRWTHGKCKGLCKRSVCHGGCQYRLRRHLRCWSGSRTRSVSVACVGFIDDFPAFEAYAKYLGETKTLFNVPPPPGNTVLNLLGAANRPLIGATMFGLLACTVPTLPQPNILDLFQLR